MVEEQKIKSIIAENSAEKAVEMLEALTAANPDDALLLTEIGKLHWRLGNRGAAMSAYKKAADIDPDSPAALLLEHADDIMAFFNPDLLNP